MPAPHPAAGGQDHIKENNNMVMKIKYLSPILRAIDLRTSRCCVNVSSQSTTQEYDEEDIFGNG